MKKMNLMLCALLFINLLSCQIQTKALDENSIQALNGEPLKPAELDEFLRYQMDSLNIPGLSIAVINDAEVVYNKTFGIIRNDSIEKVSGTTLFEAASMSKSVFAYLVMKMVEKGLLDLDTPLYKYMPYSDIEHDERYKLITARMALSHTAGFPNWRFHNEDGKLDIKFTPGTQFSYSGEGYEYLAKVIAHLTGRSLNNLDGLFQEEVAQPLEMKHSYFTKNDFVVKHKAYGHSGSEVVNNRWYTDLTQFGAAHSLHTNTDDFSKFMIAIMEEQGLKKENFNEMLKEQVHLPEGHGLREDFGFEAWGLGFIRASTPYGVKIAHGGMNPNFQSYFMLLKEKGFGFVFFTNTDNGLELLESLEKYLLSGQRLPAKRE
jgi:CubicO group peptidase (beta-lactamase class C family)